MLWPCSDLGCSAKGRAPFIYAVAAALLRGHVVLHVGALASPPRPSLLLQMLRHAGGAGMRRTLMPDIPVILLTRRRAASAIVHRRLAGPARQHRSGQKGPIWCIWPGLTVGPTPKRTVCA